MKISTKPIMSPGRTEKFPPPLMRFLRNNAGSRSRGRSRSSAIFIRKKNHNAAIETQEPSSPKVTCMGQVRVTRSSKQPAAKRVPSAAAGEGAPAKFRWVPNPLFCHRFAAKFKPCSSSCHWDCRCQPVWPNWGSFFRRKGSKLIEASTKPKLNFSGRHSYEVGEEEDEEETEQRQRASVSSVSNSCSTPPRNALLLTRCRSAPYRYSSQSRRFCDSPLSGEETGEEQRTKMENREESNEKQRHCSQRDLVLEQEGNRIKDPKFELKLKFFRELEDSIRERIMESEMGRELKRREGREEEGDSVRPVVLTRCKSEPARTAGKLDAEVKNFWKKERFGFC